MRICTTTDKKTGEPDGGSKTNCPNCGGKLVIVKLLMDETGGMSKRPKDGHQCLKCKTVFPDTLVQNLLKMNLCFVILGNKIDKKTRKQKTMTNSELNDKLGNPVQQDYYDQIIKIWMENTDDWFDMKNFLIALIRVHKNLFNYFVNWTQERFEEVE